MVQGIKHVTSRTAHEAREACGRVTYYSFSKCVYFINANQDKRGQRRFTAIIVTAFVGKTGAMKDLLDIKWSIKN
jgi:hypothetical protein